MTRLLTGSDPGRPWTTHLREHGDDPAIDRGEDFQDFVNHELRTPLTAAGTALQTLALQLERTGGRSRELVDVALRNVRRLERTVEWAADYLRDGTDPVADASAVVAVTDLLTDLDDLGDEVSWATGPGAWDRVVRVDRAAWRRLLRQAVRALGSFEPARAVHLDLCLLAEPPAEDTCGLLVVGHLPVDACGDDAEAAGDAVAHLQRLLGLTVHPELAGRLGLRADVVCLSDHLRLRLLLPLPLAAEAALPV